MNEPNLATLQFFHRMIIIRYRLTRDLALLHGVRFTVPVLSFYGTAVPYSTGSDRSYGVLSTVSNRILRTLASSRPQYENTTSVRFRTYCDGIAKKSDRGSDPVDPTSGSTTVGFNKQVYGTTNGTKDAASARS